MLIKQNLDLRVRNIHCEFIIPWRLNIWIVVILRNPKRKKISVHIFIQVILSFVQREGYLAPQEGSGLH